MHAFYGSDFSSAGAAPPATTTAATFLQGGSSSSAATASVSSQQPSGSEAASLNAAGASGCSPREAPTGGALLTAADAGKVVSPSSFAAAASASAATVTAPLARHTRRCLLDGLNSVPGKKMMVLDESLAGALSLLVDAATLQQEGVDRCFPLRVYPLPAASLSPAAAAASLVFFFCRSRLKLLPLLVQHIHYFERYYPPTQPVSANSVDFSSCEEGGAPAADEAESLSSTVRASSPNYGDGLSASAAAKDAGELNWSFPLPTSFSPSGRHYYVIFVPVASEFIASEFRRLLSSAPPLPLLETAAAAAPSSASAAAAPPQQRQRTSGPAAAASIFSNLSSLPASLFGAAAASTGFSAAATTAAAAAATATLFGSKEQPQQQQQQQRQRQRQRQLCASAADGAADGAAPPPLSQESATVSSCPLFFFPLAPDLLSLELARSFRDLHVHGDPSPGHLVADAILHLQEQLQQGGLVPHMRCLGTAAKAVADYLIQQRKERQALLAEKAQQHPLSGGGAGAVGAGGGGADSCKGAKGFKAYYAERVQQLQRHARLQAVRRRAGADEEDAAQKAANSAHEAEKADEFEASFLTPLLPRVAPPVRFVLSKEDFTVNGTGLTKETPAAKTPVKGDAASKREQQPRRSAVCEESPAKSPSDPAESNAAAVAAAAATARRQRVLQQQQQRESLKIDMLVIIDRRSDLITPLCTAFTYEALLDSVFGLETASVEVPQQLLQQQPQQQQQPHYAVGDNADNSRPSAAAAASSIISSEKGSAAAGWSSTSNRVAVGIPVLMPLGPRKRVSLAGDGVYALLRDLHQSAVGGRLHSIASEIQQTYREKEGLRSIQDISVFINKFRVKQKEHSSLSLHVRLASFLAAVTQDPAFVQRLTMEDELLQANVGSSSVIMSSASAAAAAPPLKSVLVTQLENLLEDAASADLLWWNTCGAGATPASTAQDGLTQRVGEMGVGSASSSSSSPFEESSQTGRWRGVAAAASRLDDFYRLLCLASQVNGGLRAKQLQDIRTGLLQHFGLPELERLALLQRVGLLRFTDGSATATTKEKQAAPAAAATEGSSRTKKQNNEDVEWWAGAGCLTPGSWRILKKECNLLVDSAEGDEQQMMDSIAYACSGYAPLSVRLVEFLFSNSNGWRAIPHVLSLLNGPAMEVRQQQQQQHLAFPSPALGIQRQQQQRRADATNLLGGDEQLYRQEQASGPPQENVTTVMVLYVGGVTYAEIAAIRRLNELELMRYHKVEPRQQQRGTASGSTLRRFVIVTTDIINSKKLFASCGQEEIDFCERFPYNATFPLPQSSSSDTL